MKYVRNKYFLFIIFLSVGGKALPLKALDTKPRKAVAAVPKKNKVNGRTTKAATVSKIQISGKTSPKSSKKRQVTLKKVEKPSEVNAPWWSTLSSWTSSLPALSHGDMLGLGILALCGLYYMYGGSTSQNTQIPEGDPNTQNNESPASQGIPSHIQQEKPEEPPAKPAKPQVKESQQQQQRQLPAKTAKPQVKESQQRQLPAKPAQPPVENPTNSNVTLDSHLNKWFFSSVLIAFGGFLSRFDKKYCMSLCALSGPFIYQTDMYRDLPLGGYSTLLPSFGALLGGAYFWYHKNRIDKLFKAFIEWHCCYDFSPRAVSSDEMDQIINMLTKDHLQKMYICCFAILYKRNKLDKLKEKINKIGSPEKDDLVHKITMAQGIWKFIHDGYTKNNWKREWSPFLSNYDILRNAGEWIKKIPAEEFAQLSIGTIGAILTKYKCRGEEKSDEEVNVFSKDQIGAITPDALDYLLKGGWEGGIHDRFIPHLSLDAIEVLWKHGKVQDKIDKMTEEQKKHVEDKLFKAFIENPLDHDFSPRAVSSDEMDQIINMLTKDHLQQMYLSYFAILYEHNKLDKLKEKINKMYEDGSHEKTNLVHKITMAQEIGNFIHVGYRNNNWEDEWSPFLSRYHILRNSGEWIRKIPAKDFAQLNIGAIDEILNKYNYRGEEKSDEEVNVFSKDQIGAITPDALDYLLKDGWDGGIHDRFIPHLSLGAIWALWKHGKVQDKIDKMTEEQKKHVEDKLFKAFIETPVDHDFSPRAVSSDEMDQIINMLTKDHLQQMYLCCFAILYDRNKLDKLKEKINKMYEDGSPEKTDLMNWIKIEQEIGNFIHVGYRNNNWKDEWSPFLSAYDILRNSGEWIKKIPEGEFAQLNIGTIAALLAADYKGKKKSDEEVNMFSREQISYITVKALHDILKNGWKGSIHDYFISYFSPTVAEFLVRGNLNGNKFLQDEQLKLITLDQAKGFLPCDTAQDFAQLDDKYFAWKRCFSDEVQKVIQFIREDPLINLSLSLKAGKGLDPDDIKSFLEKRELYDDFYFSKIPQDDLPRIQNVFQNPMVIEAFQDISDGNNILQKMGEDLHIREEIHGHLSDRDGKYDRKFPPLFGPDDAKAIDKAQLQQIPPEEFGSMMADTIAVFLCDNGRLSPEQTGAITPEQLYEICQGLPDFRIGDEYIPYLSLGVINVLWKHGKVQDKINKMTEEQKKYVKDKNFNAFIGNPLSHNFSLRAISSYEMDQIINMLTKNHMRSLRPVHFGILYEHKKLYKLKEKINKMYEGGSAEKTNLMHNITMVQEIGNFIDDYEEKKWNRQWSPFLSSYYFREKAGKWITKIPAEDFARLNIGAIAELLAADYKGKKKSDKEIKWFSGKQIGYITVKAFDGLFKNGWKGSIHDNFIPHLSLGAIEVLWGHDKVQDKIDKMTEEQARYIEENFYIPYSLHSQFPDNIQRLIQEKEEKDLVKKLVQHHGDPLFTPHMKTEAFEGIVMDSQKYSKEYFAQRPDFIKDTLREIPECPEQLKNLMNEPDDESSNEGLSPVSKSANSSPFEP